MLYFSKTKLLSIYLLIVFLLSCAFLNFSNNKDNIILSKKVNLGLDLQGGSYLLLEVDSLPIINQNLQQKVINLRKYLKENKIRYNFGDGDLIYMYDNCQDLYEHSLRKGKNDNIRISLVFKKHIIS